MEFEPHMRLVQKTTLELRRSSNPASSALSHTAWLMPPTSLWLVSQAMPFAVSGTPLFSLPCGCRLLQREKHGIVSWIR